MKSPATEGPYVANGDEPHQSNPPVLRPNAILFISALTPLLLPIQYGWSLSQLNLSTFNDEHDCNAEPVEAGTCLMFPGHSKLEWTFAVNAWILGGMIGSLSTGGLADRFGRLFMLRMDCIIMIAGAVIQLSVSNVWAFTVGRLLAGIGSGCATSIVSMYIGEISPPHLRSTLGSGFNLSVSIGILLVSITFFFANTESGWRYIAGFPIVLALLFLVLSLKWAVKSPVWLLSKGRQEEAEGVLARLYGRENVPTALGWLQSDELDVARPITQDPTSSVVEKEETSIHLFSKATAAPLIVALVLGSAQQLGGVNSVFYFSSQLFTEAGVSDDRIGTIVISGVNCIPNFMVGYLSSTYGNRRMILIGLVVMLLSAICITISLTCEVAVLSIVFSATYACGFSIGIGPLVYVVLPELFPHAIRSNGVSLCIAVNWLCNLAVGISYPYIVTAIGDLSFLPFIGFLTVFIVFFYFFLPETRGKSADEIQALFSARK